MPQRRTETVGLEEWSPWNPIETAPKDGTRVLLWIPGTGELVYSGCFNTYQHYLNGDLTSETAKWFWGQTHWMTLGKEPEPDPQPTHWMPLPSAPKIL
jgi:hypothetical protein